MKGPITLIFVLFIGFSVSTSSSRSNKRPSLYRLAEAQGVSLPEASTIANSTPLAPVYTSKKTPSATSTGTSVAPPTSSSTPSAKEVPSKEEAKKEEKKASSSTHAEKKDLVKKKEEKHIMRLEDLAKEDLTADDFIGCHSGFILILKLYIQK